MIVLKTGSSDMKQLLEDKVVELIRVAVTQLPKDVIDALNRAFETETSDRGRIQLKNILENVKLSAETGIPMCQDTGIPIFYVNVGSKFGDISYIIEALENAVRRATSEVPIRPNMVHPITRENTGVNVGLGIPIIHWDMVDAEYLEITALPKGAGCENKTRLAMLRPGEGLKGIKSFVIDTIIDSGAEFCPPAVVGVGIGGSSDLAVDLAKRATLRSLNKRSSDPDIALLEEELLDIANSLGVGPMGLGGINVALAVNIEYAYTHTASLPVAVNFQCWAVRQATGRLYSDGRFEVLSGR